MNGDQSKPKQKAPNGLFWLLLLLLGGTFAVLCRVGFLPYEVFFANDSALGAMKDSSARLPGMFTGYWSDFWWLGGAVPSSSPSVSSLFASILSPEHYLKVYAPLTMVFMGCCVWFFFRQLRFAPMACVIAGLGAGLNMHFFSNACWGLGTWDVSAAMVFVALGILVSPDIRQLWIKGVLAGLSVGMVVMEGFDVGAIFSIYVGIFLVFYFLTTESNPAQGALKAAGAGTLVVVFAVFISASTLYTLVGTQLTGTGGAGESDQDKEAHWDFITQWSIPKLESFRVFIPGLFGYRMQEFTTSTNKSGSYWGKVAEDPRIERLESSDSKTRVRAADFLGVQTQIRDIFAGDDVKTRQEILDQVKDRVQRRHTGSGEYAGLLVCLLAVFGLVNSIRKADSPYSAQERWATWFWGGVGLFSLLAAWGQHGFVYRFIYELPFLSNIRSPMKFMHPLNISLIILSGYGLEVLHRRYLGAPPKGRSFFRVLFGGIKKFSGFDKKWAIGSLMALLASVAALLIFMASRADLTAYLEHNGFGKDVAPQIAEFSISEVGWYVIYLTISAGLIVSILTGAFAGNKAAFAWAGLSAIMICDLARADVPWIRYFNYKQKYTMNPVVDLLRKDPWEHRVVSRTSPMGGYDLGGSDQNFGGLCHWWLENDYPYNDIQSLEIDQAPRMPVLDSAYIGNFGIRSGNDLTPALRLWKLTNTRYIFADARLEALLNQLAQPPNSFHTIMRMDMAIKPGVSQVEDAGDMTVKTNATGSLALIEFPGALPRCKLYSNWQMADDQTTLQLLLSPGFNVDKTVLVATNTPLSEKPGSTEADPGTVEITHYQSKHVVLQADAKTPAVLLLNDRTGDWWRVWVDQTPAPILRCNYIMQGVFVPPGQHTIDFRYQPPLKFLYVSVAALVIGVFLGGYVIFNHFWLEPRVTPKRTA
ncbi:MAG TPA: hypothetical protein VMQ67_01865 [Candidatus Saccharimonadales bacterium]|nr:hypothetical protein [Candidatus Saccharimonadales bacterium]